MQEIFVIYIDHGLTDQERWFITFLVFIVVLGALRKK